jgi:hypothetical protein
MIRASAPRLTWVWVPPAGASPPSGQFVTAHARRDTWPIGRPAQGDTAIGDRDVEYRFRNWDCINRETK